MFFNLHSCERKNVKIQKVFDDSVDCTACVLSVPHVIVIPFYVTLLCRSPKVRNVCTS